MSHSGPVPRAAGEADTSDEREHPARWPRPSTRGGVALAAMALALCALVATAFLMHSPPAEARPLALLRNYPGAAPCNTTLQACVSGSADGDVVNVSAGTYITDQVVITRA